MKKAKIYMWLGDVQIVRMGTDAAYNARVVLDSDNGSLENICTVMQAAMPSNDVESLIHLMIETAKYSKELGESQKDMETRIYHAIMAESTFNKGRL